MHSQFIKEFVNIIYRFCNNNVIIIRKNRRIKKLFEIFIKHTFILFLIIILKEINLFSSYSKSSFKGYINYFRRCYSFL